MNEEAVVKVGEIMTKDVVSVGPHTPFKAIVERLVQSDVSGVPVLDESGRCSGS